MEPEFHLDLPKFPVEALHILEREYTHQSSTNGRAENLTLDEYIEQRLIELFPDEAYLGMLEETADLIEELTLDYEKYLADLEAYEIAISAEIFEEDEFVPFTSLEEEIELTDMTQEEIAYFMELEAIASADDLITGEELNDLLDNSASSGRSDGGILEIWAVLNVGGVPGVAGLATWRILQARSRAEQRAGEFYPGNTSAGERGDAFRHIFVSMHLRRYLTRVGAWAVMGAVEANRDLRRTNTPRDRQMDLHNNKIGRDTRYRQFRGRWWKDRRDWRRWSGRVKGFVDNTNNGFLMNWRSNEPDTQRARREANNVPNTRYIWY